MTAADQVRVGAIIVAAGSGERFGDREKILTTLAGQPMLAFSLRTVSSLDEVCQVVVVAGEHTTDEVRGLVAAASLTNVTICKGGATRRDSVRSGFARLEDNVDLVLVHDAARPLASPALMDRVVREAAKSGAAVPSIAVGDTVYRVSATGQAEALIDRDTLRLAQTPQVARREWLCEALAREDAYTDEGSALMACGFPVMTVPGCRDNVKITWPGDVALAESIIARRRS